MKTQDHKAQTERCLCIKIDGYGESDCKYATCDPSAWGFVCSNECVITMTKKLNAEKEARIAAEEKLKKYREAIGPFVDNCRAVINVVDNEKGEQHE